MMEETCNENDIIDFRSSDDVLSVEPIECDDGSQGAYNELVLAQGTQMEIVACSESGDKALEPPHVGIRFPTYQDAERYYERYAKQEGFGVVKASWNYRMKGGKRTDEIRCVTWKCDCHGKPDKRRKVNGKRVMKKGLPSPNEKRSSKKCDCPAQMHVIATESNEWEVRNVVLEHQNHTPSPSKTRHIPKYRKQELNCHVVKTLFDSHAAGASIPQIHKTLAIERNGFRNFSLTERDLRNVMDKNRRLKMEGGDSNSMMRYLRLMAEDNPNFFYTLRLDEGSNLKDIMWVDARCRAAYEEFGDVVCFDATYMTNKFELPFVNFVGTNHHGQTTLFGCALLSHEDIETYTWLFSTWLTCMKGKAPPAILTDQDAAMRKAVELTMPQSKHRWCIWHILSKLKTKLGTVENYKEFKADLKRAIYESLSEDEFVTSWNSVIMAYKQENNVWLQGLYEEREMWIPVYMKDTFWAGMKTTQRSESIHRFFKGYVNSTTKMYEFPEKYCFALEVRANEEKEVDSKCWRRTRKVLSEFQVESTFLDLYTDAKFLEVQVQCQRCLYVTPLERRDVTTEVVEHIFEDKVYVKCPNTRKEVSTNRRATYCVWFNKTTKDAGCECKHFETRGIMCRHLVKVYDMYKVDHVPEKFILRRWRKDIQRKHKVVKVAYHDASKSEEVKRFDKLMIAFQEVCLKASLLEENVDNCLELIQLMDIRVEQNNNRVRAQQLGMAQQSTPSSAGNKNGLISTPQTLSTPQSSGYFSAFEGSTLQNQAYEYYSDGRTAQSRNHPPKQSDGRTGQSNPSFDVASQSTSCRDGGTQSANSIDANSIHAGTPNGEFSIGDPQSRKTKGQNKNTGRLKSAVEKAVNASKRKKPTQVPPSEDHGEAQRIIPIQQRQQASVFHGNQQPPHQPILTHNIFQPQQPHQLHHMNVGQSPAPPSHGGLKPAISRQLFPMQVEFPWDFGPGRDIFPKTGCNVYSNKEYPALNNGAYSTSNFEAVNGSSLPGAQHKVCSASPVVRPFFAVDSHANKVVQQSFRPPDINNLAFGPE